MKYGVDRLVANSNETDTFVTRKEESGGADFILHPQSNIRF